MKRQRSWPETVRTIQAALVAVIFGGGMLLIAAHTYQHWTWSGAVMFAARMIGALGQQGAGIR